MLRRCSNLLSYCVGGKKPLNDREQACGHNLVPISVHVEPVEAAMPVVIA